MIFKESTDKFKKIFFLPVILVLLILLINTKFTLWPEMVVYPYLLNNGFINYKDLINPYPPALPGFLSIFTDYFGYDAGNFQILTWSIVLLITLQIFYICLKISKSYYVSFLASLFFTVVSVPLGINGLWFDLVLTPFVLFSFYNFYLFLKNKKEINLFLSFSTILLATQIKQQILILPLWYLLIILFEKIKIQKILKTLIISTIPLFLSILGTSFFYVKNGTFQDFFFWTFFFPLFKASGAPGYISLPDTKELIYILSIFLVFISVFFQKGITKKLSYISALPLLVFIFPRFDYFHLIPAFSLLVISVANILEIKKNIPIIYKVITTMSLIIIAIFCFRYYAVNWYTEVRFFERDIITTASFIDKIIEPGAKLYIQNGPDQLFVLTNRLPPKPWADEFSWYLESNGLQEKVIKGIQEENIKFAVYKPYDDGSNLELGSYRPKQLADYLDLSFENYVQISDKLWLKVKKEN